MARVRTSVFSMWLLLLCRQDLTQEGAKLDFSPGAARLYIAEHAPEVSHVASHGLHLLEKPHVTVQRFVPPPLAVDSLKRANRAD
jgi:hypothetical protein